MSFTTTPGRANLGYALTAATQLRVIARNSDAAVGTPGPFNFYGIANAGKRADQDIYLGASAENRTIGGWHNLVRYGHDAQARSRISTSIPRAFHLATYTRQTITVTIPLSVEPTATL